MKTKLADKNLVVKFSDTLDAHVRFEERELFNYLQENIFEKDLADLVALDKTRNHEAGEVWEDKFWEKNVV